MRELTATRSQMVAVGRAAHLRKLVEFQSQATPKAVADGSATAFGVGFCREFTIPWVLLARPTATLRDTFGIKWMSVKRGQTPKTGTARRVLRIFGV